MKKSMQKTAKQIVKILFASILVAILIFTVDWKEVFVYIRNVHPVFVGLFVVFYICGIMISARKWQVLGQSVQFKNTYFFYLKTYVLGTFLNNFFPSFVGGDAYRTIALNGSAKRFGDSSATVVVDRVSGLIAIIFLALVCGALNYSALVHVVFLQGFFIFLFIVLVLFISFVWFFHTPFVQRVVAFLPRFVERYITILVQFRTRSIAVRSFVYSVFFSLVGIAIANYMLFVAVGTELSFVDYISVVFLTNLIASLPISMGNIGTKEWAYILLFGVFGVSSSAVVAIVLLSRVLQMLVSFVALPLYIQNKDKITQ